MLPCALVLAFVVVAANGQQNFVASAAPFPDYDAAARACGPNGLARIESEADQVRAAAACGARVCWIDLKDCSLSGLWSYSDGSGARRRAPPALCSPHPTSLLTARRWSRRTAAPLYTNWNAQHRQPNNYGGSEPYAAINAGAAAQGAGCTERCAFAGDGDCDDGGVGAEYGACGLASDCTDCGARAPQAGPVLNGSWFDSSDGAHAHALCNTVPRNSSSNCSATEPAERSQTHLCKMLQGSLCDGSFSGTSLCAPLS